MYLDSRSSPSPEQALHGLITSLYTRSIYGLCRAQFYVPTTMPPSTRKTSPEMKLASSEARNK